MSFPEIVMTIEGNFYGGKFAWKAPGSSGAMSFEVKRALSSPQGWQLECVDGNGREFVAHGQYHHEAMFQAMGLAMGLDEYGKITGE